MANQVLAKSSWFCMVLHILANLTSAKDGPIFLRAMQILGVLTSIWNHSVTDRVTIVTATVVDIIYLTQLPSSSLQILVGALMMGATVCFFSAKRAQTTEISEQKNDNAAKSRVYAAWRDLYHVSVHLFTTGANLVLSSSLLASP